jgi:hypothetical protein
MAPVMFGDAEEFPWPELATVLSDAKEIDEKNG